jgi:hypothetical protein
MESMVDPGRVRHRQGRATVVDGMPYSNRETTLSLLPGAVVGRWLADNADAVSGVLLDLGAGNTQAGVTRPPNLQLADH